MQLKKLTVPNQEQYTMQQKLTNYTITMLLNTKFDNNAPVINQICVIGQINQINIKKNHVELVLSDLTGEIKCCLWDKNDTIKDNKQLKFRNDIYIITLHITIIINSYT